MHVPHMHDQNKAHIHAVFDNTVFDNARQATNKHPHALAHTGVHGQQNRKYSSSRRHSNVDRGVNVSRPTPHTRLPTLALQPRAAGPAFQRSKYAVTFATVPRPSWPSNLTHSTPPPPQRCPLAGP
eukprot:GDKI01009471.1.p1 GENE.GDKI01009471.1~~GDKI01009471.1.p1  ORF type:complete len:126 (+),score=13.33 GDKI01009471.1:191-568(+)